MSAASALPSWLLLDNFVFDRSFPDDTAEAPIIRASGTSSGGDSFCIAFSVAEPPQISRLYAQLPLPEGSRPQNWRPVSVVATHRHLALVRFATEEPGGGHLVQNFFIFNTTDSNSNSSSSLKLKALPACTEPIDACNRKSVRRLPPRRGRPSDVRPRRGRPSDVRPRRGRPDVRPHRGCPSDSDDDDVPRLLSVRSLGLWCGDDQEFVVAELTDLFFPNRGNKVFADICLLRSSSTSSSDAAAVQPGDKWESVRVPIDSSAEEDLCRFAQWLTDRVIPFRQWLCWINCQLGIIFCDMSKPSHPPTISFVWFPYEQFPCPTSILYCGVSVVDHGGALKFVRIVRSDGAPADKPFQPGACFSITCHTLVLCAGGKMEWKLDYEVTSSELWEANPIQRLPRTILMLPQVDIHRPQVLHLVAVEYVLIKKKMWVVSIDMSTKTVESCSLYMDGTAEGSIRTDEEAVRILCMSQSPFPFLPFEIPKFLRLSRKRKDLD